MAKLLICPNCGQTYNPKYIRFCARCGEAVPDAKGRMPKLGPLDGMGARGGASGRKPVPPVNTNQPFIGDSTARAVTPTAGLEDIILEYRNHLNDQPDDYPTRYALALAWCLAGNWSAAANELEAVVAAQPEYVDAWHRLALVRVRLGQNAQALEAAKQGLARDPDRAGLMALMIKLTEQ